jgi:hypothetical protein
MFVQIIEGRTNDPKALAERGESWQRDMKPGAVGFLGVTAGTTADGRAITVARFESEDAARKNSERPEQGEWWAETAKLYDGEPSFSESSDVTEWMGGGSNDAGFVQIMKSKGVDRAQLERMDAAFEPLAGNRPDLLGGIRIWTGPDACIDVAYFTSEAAAREGEKSEMPEELKGLMAEMEGAMGDTEYLDLSEPSVH